MRRLLALGIALSLCLGASGPLFADKGKKEKKEEVAEKIRAYRKIIIAEELGLDEATSARLFPVLDGYMDQMRVVRKEQRKIRAQIDAEAGKQKPDEKKIEELLDALTEKELEFQQLKIEAFQATKGILTPVQRVELLELLPDVDRRIREMISAAKKGK